MAFGYDMIDAVNVGMNSTLNYSNTIVTLPDNTTSLLPVTLSPAQEHSLTTLKYYLSCVLGVIVIILGLIGNTLTIAVLTQRTMHTSTNFYLTALAVWDTVILIITLFLICIPEMSITFKIYAFPYILVYIYPLALVAQTATIWITVSFTVERYIAVCHPLKSTRMCTIQRARAVIISVTVSAFLYNIVRWFEYRLDTSYNNSTMSYTIGATQAAFVSTHMYQRVYYLWLYQLVMCVIPLVSLTILNTFLIVAVRKSTKQRRDMNVRQSRENNVTIMLVSVVIVFIICQVPALVYNMAHAINTDTIYTRFGWSTLSIVRNFLVNLNSAVNFMLYCAFGQKFRRIFTRTFCRCLLSEDDWNSLTHHTNTCHMTGINIQNQGRYRRGLLHRKKKFGCDIYDLTASTRTSILSRSPRSSPRQSPRSSFDATTPSGRSLCATLENHAHINKGKLNDTHLRVPMSRSAPMLSEVQFDDINGGNEALLQNSSNNHIKPIKYSFKKARKLK